MRRFIKSLIPIGVFVLSIFIINGCYTQFSAPEVDTYDEYYVVDEEDEVYYDEYQEQEPYYYEEGYADSAAVNYNYYDVYNYNYPTSRYYDPWYSYGYSSYYSPYDMYYYSGYYPDYWWDPFYQVYMPGWWVSYWSYGHYWHRYPRYYHHYGGRYYVTPATPKQKRQFARRNSSPVDMKQKNASQSGVTRRSKRIPKDLDRSKVVVDRDEIRNRNTAPGSKNRLINRKDRPVIDKGKIRTSPDESKAKRIITRQSDSQKSGKRIVRPAPKKSTTKGSKPEARKSKYSQPKKIYIPPNKVKRVVRPRTNERGTVNKSRPAVRKTDRNSKPPIRRTIKPRTSSKSKQKSSVRKSRPTPKSRPTFRRPSKPTIKRSSPSRPSVKRSSPASSSRSSRSSGSKKSSGSKSSKKK